MDLDHEISETELQYLDSVRQAAGIDESEFRLFYNSVIGKTEREIYQIGMAAINECSETKRLTFLLNSTVWLLPIKFYAPKKFDLFCMPRAWPM
jgi:hypothetical protein